MDDALIERARLVARIAHGAVGQRRKYTDEPYHLHPEAVALRVRASRFGGDPEVVAAAHLHDVLEDTQVDAPTLTELFGPRVVHLVRQVTDVSRPEHGDRATRKAMDRAHVAAASAEAKTIKLADLIDNARTVAVRDPAFARIYMPEKRALLAVLGDGDAGLYAQARAIVDGYFAG